MYFISIRIFTKKTEVRGELGISMHLITYDIMMPLVNFQALTRIRISAIPRAQHNEDVALDSQIIGHFSSSPVLFLPLWFKYCITILSKLKPSFLWGSWEEGLRKSTKYTNLKKILKLSRLIKPLPLSQISINDCRRGDPIINWASYHCRKGVTLWSAELCVTHRTPCRDSFGEVSPWFGGLSGDTVALKSYKVL